MVQVLGVGVNRADSSILLSALLRYTFPREFSNKIAGASDRKGQAAVRPTGRTAQGKPVGAVQRVRDARMSLQGITTRKARPLLPAELHPAGQEYDALRTEAEPRSRQAAVAQLRPATDPCRSMDRLGERDL